MYKYACLRPNLGLGLSIVVVLVVLIFIASAHISQVQAVAGINRTINFQGKLVDEDGLNVSDTSYTVVFTIYDRSSGGTALWTETQSVTTEDGVFRVALGSDTAIPANFNFNWDGLYLGMKVDADSEMTPRIRLTAVPYAFNAEKVSGLTVQDESGNASTSGTLRVANNRTITFNDAFTTTGGGITLTATGTTNASFASTGSLTLVDETTSQTLTSKIIGNTGLTFTDASTDITTGSGQDLTVTANGAGDIVLSQDADSAVLIGSASNTPAVLSVSGGFGSNAAMIVNQTNSGDILVASSSGVTKFVINNSGNVGLGTTAPQARLDVIGANGTTPTASFSATSAFAGLIIDQAGSGDVLTASTSGQMRFTVKQDGRLQLSNLVYNGSCTALETDANGYITCGTDAEGISTQWNDVTGGINYAGGNVGIGTTAPIHKLHITGTANSKALVLVEGDGNQDLFTASASGSTKFLVDKTGNVGIGTTAPTGKLHVFNDVNGGEGIISRVNSNTLESAAGYFYNAVSGIDPWQEVRLAYFDGDLTDYGVKIDSRSAFGSTIYGLNVNVSGLGTEYAAVFTGGNVGIGASAPLAMLHLTRPLSLGANGKALAIFDQIENQDIFTASAGGTTRFVINNAGNVGIGTTNPSGALEVSDGGSFLMSDSSLSHGVTSLAPTNTFLKLAAGVGGETGTGMIAGFSSDSNPGLIVRGTNDGGGGSGAVQLIASKPNGTGLQGLAATDRAFTFDNHVTNLMAILGGGNIGLGTGAPGAELHVTRPHSFGANGKALAIFDQIENQDIFTASASGTTRFVIENDGDLKIAAGQSIDTFSPGSLGIGTTNATSAVLGSSALESFTVTTNGTGNTEVVLPNQSIGAAEIADDTIDFGQISNSSTLDEDTTVAFSTLDLVLDLTSTGEFYIRDAGNDFAQFLADGTITLGKAASATAINLGIGTGADTIAIGTDNTVGDTLTIGNNNASTTLSLVGGDDWSITSAGEATFVEFYGAGLTDCDAATSKILWNDATGTFSCGTDMGSNLQVVDFTDTTTEVATFATAMDIWDGTRPNITPGSTNSEILISVNIRGTSDDANDQTPVFIIRRAIGSDPVCTGGSPSTAIGGEFAGGFLTATTQDWGATVTTSDAPSSTGNVRYTVCTTTTGADDGNTDEVRVVLTEIGSASGGGGSGNVSVRETDSSPSVASASTIEFGPATNSSDEFIVTDEGSGVARIRIGTQVGLLNEGETVTGGWTFNTSSTTFTTGILANGGLDTTSNTNLSLAANGTGNIVINTDADTGVKIGSTSNTSAVLSVRGGIGNNAALIVDQLNNGNIFAASSSGTTRFVVDASGNLEVGGSVNLATGNLAFSNTGGITLTGGTISDITDEVDINDDVAVAGNVGLTGTTGLTFTGSGADITFTNFEQLSNDTDGSITFGRNDAGTVTLNARDDDATAALSILSGGAAALTLDTGGAAGLNIGTTNSNLITIGNTGSSTSLALTKGASGNITLTGFNCSTLTNGGVLTTDASGNILCQNDDGGAATATYWDATQGALYPNNSTYDVLFGGTATASAKFGFLNINNGGTPTATISATTGNSLVLDANGNIRTTKAQALTLGGGDSGEVYTASLLRLDSTNGIRGGGLSDCDNPATAKLLWDDSTNRFSCGTDQGGGEGSSMTVRESDSSPAVSAVAVLEFGPGTTSSDEFIVTDEGSGIARVRVGNQVGILNEAETVTGGWTFNTAATTFTTGILANGGLDTTANTNLSLAANGSGKIVLATDADTGVYIGSSGNTPGVLSVRGGIGNNAALIVDQLNSGNIFVASSSGTTRFAIDNAGNFLLSGGAISDSSDGVDINDDLDVSGAVNLSTGNVAFSSTGGISLAGGSISDSVGSVIVNDNLSVAGTTGITFTSTGSINLAGGTISDSSGDVDINDNLTVAGTTGLTLSGSGADLIFANGESFTNDTNNTLTLRRNDAGTVVLNAADDDATAALTINSGGAAALTLDTGGGAALSIGNANASSVTIGNTANGFGVTINTGTGTLNLGDVATTKAIEIGGVDSDATDSLSISTNASSADTINIGNGNAATLMSLTGGNDWSISSAGLATFTKLAGAGLSDCDTADTSKLLWDSTNQTFSCGTDASAPPTVKRNTFSGTTGITATEQSILSVSITPSSANSEIWAVGVLNTDSTTAQDRTVTQRLRRGASCAAGTQFGIDVLSFTTNATEFGVATGVGLDTPATTSSTTYHLCAVADNTGINAISASLVVMEVNLGADVAELYNTNDTTLSIGDVVELDPSLHAGVKKGTKAFGRVLGVVSTQPALLIGGGDRGGLSSVPVALSGRVPVKTTTENGPITQGDFLTAASKPGYAMKAIKAGPVIGQAMTPLPMGEGEVLVFVKNGYFTGMSLAEHFDGLSIDHNDSFAVLQSLLDNPVAPSAGAGVSDVFTDRVVAGLEVITPRVIADEIFAKTIRADKIIGLELLESGIKEQAGKIKNIEDLLAGASAKITPTPTPSADSASVLSASDSASQKLLTSVDEMLRQVQKDREEKPQSLLGTNYVEEFSARQATISATFRVQGDSLFEGVLSVIESITTNNLFVSGLAQFFGEAVFKDSVRFESAPVFNGDTAGYAILKKDEKTTEIKFSKAYEETPVITVSVISEQMTDQEFELLVESDSCDKDDRESCQDMIDERFFDTPIEFVITKKSKEGFVIRLPENARQNYTFSWTAIAVRKVSSSEKSSELDKKAERFLDNLISKND